jgi:hypothetical protein
MKDVCLCMYLRDGLRLIRPLHCDLLLCFVTKEVRNASQMSVSNSKVRGQTADTGHEDNIKMYLKK